MPIKNPQEPFTRISAQEAKEMLDGGDSNVAVIDVRQPGEYEAGRLPDSKLIPVASVFARREELPRDKDIIFACSVGQRSALACEMAAAAGLTRLYNLEGGLEAWLKAGLPIEK
jgi:rhodanese-related sulfurtransferase